MVPEEVPEIPVLSTLDPRSHCLGFRALRDFKEFLWVPRVPEFVLVLHVRVPDLVEGLPWILDRYILTCLSASQHTQEKVHLLIQLAESMLAKGHAHRTELRRCVSTVDKRYRDFTVRMGQYRHVLETALGGCSQVSVQTSL